MPGGLIQLAAYGSENLYLMGNPQITFFKIVYKQHTNFSVEPIELELEERPKISNMSSNSTTVKVKIPRLGDLLSNLFVKVDIPNIISSKYRKFKWVENLGEVMIKTASLYIGGQKIETLTSEWLNIYNNLTLTADKKKIYDVMIGNIDTLINPEMDNSQFIEIIKKTLLDDNYNKDDENDTYFNSFVSHVNKLNVMSQHISDEEANVMTKINTPKIIKLLFDLMENINCVRKSNHPYYDPNDVLENQIPLRPSINETSLYIPLPFYFSKNVGLSLPLVALQYQEVEVHIELSPMIHLYTILEWNETTSKYTRQQPNSLNENQCLSYYVYDRIPINLPIISEKPDNNNIKELNENECFSNNQYENSNHNVVNENKVQSAYNNINYTLNINLEAFFIFLDTNERKLFAKSQHEYLIEQTSFQGKEGFHGESSKINMTLYNPVKEIIWVLKRSDVNKYNQWFNYTNNIISDNKTLVDDICHNNKSKVKSRDPIQPKNILKKAKISFNGIDRFNYKNNIFLNYLQSYLYHTSCIDGIYMFSFSLEPEKFQPSGCVNMSMINDVSLEFQTSVPPVDPEIKSVLSDCSSTDSDNKIVSKIRNSVGIQYRNDINGNAQTCYVKDKEIYEYTYDLSIYVVNYNILKIMGGMAGLAYNK